MKIAVNGRLVDGEKAVVSVYDHGFLYGIGCFETFRTYDGAPFLISEHLERLREGCREMGIRLRPGLLEPDGRDLRPLIAALLEANGLKDAYFRLSVSAGIGELGLASGDCTDPTVVLYVKPLPPSDGDGEARGKPLQLLNLRRNSPEGPVRRKSFHFLNNWLAKRELALCTWLDDPGAEGLLLDGRGRLAEGIVSSLFFVRDGVLRTPALETGILPGITRKAVLALAGLRGIAAEEGLYGVGELVRAEEMFVTNSVRELVPIRAVYDPEGRILWESPDGAGPVTAALLDDYRKWARKGVDTVDEIAGGTVQEDGLGAPRPHL